jgi:O-antigen/teichoic acid export membrane protein
MRIAIVAGVIGAGLGVGARLALPEAFAGLTVGETAAAAAALPFWLAFFYTGYVALSIDRYEAFVVPPAVQAVLAFAFGLAGAIAFDLAGAVAGLAIGTAMVGVGTAVWGARRLPATAAPEPPGIVKRAMSFGIRGYMANALQFLNYRIDIFILSAAASAAAVGQYAIAVGVTTVLWLLPNALADVLFPRIATLTARDAEEHREMVELKGLRHVVVIAVLVTAVLALALVLLVVPVYGEEFRPAIDVGLILLPGTALIGIANVLGSSLLGRGFPQYGLYTVAITVPLTIVLFATMIPAWEAEGAALASTISYTVTTALTIFFYSRVTGRNVARAMIPTRSEWHDLVNVPRAALEWARGLRR